MGGLEFVFLIYSSISREAFGGIQLEGGLYGCLYPSVFVEFLKKKIRRSDLA